MKKVFLFVLLASVLVSCQTVHKPKNKQLINVSIEPQKFLIDRIGGGKYQVNVVVKQGQNHETYEPTPQQMVLLEQAAFYLMLCAEGFDQIWVAKIKSRQPNMAVFDLSSGIDLLDAEHNCNAQNHEHHNHHGVDPHLWVSPSTMKTLAWNTYNALLECFPDDSLILQKGFEYLNNDILAVDSLYAQSLAPYKGKAFMVYHPVLGYVARDYGLEQINIEAEGKEPSVEDIKNLIVDAKAKDVRLIFVQKEFDTRNAQLIASETGAQVKVINPMNYDWFTEAKGVLNDLVTSFKQ